MKFDRNVNGVVDNSAIVVKSDYNNNTATFCKYGHATNPQDKGMTVDRNQKFLQRI